MTINDIDKEYMPKHIAIIMDGNRRWAKEKGIDTKLGHKAGAETLEKIAAFANDIGLQYMTVYAFSTENWKRTKEEVGALMILLRTYLDKFLNKESLRNIRIRVLGDIENLDKGLKESIEKIVEKSKNNTGLTLNIAFNYGGRAEIARAVRNISEKVKNNEFEIDGVHYKWMTLEQMEREAEKKEHNKNERRTFARYIFTPARYTDLYSEPRKNVWKMPHNVCIRLNRKCDLSCKFCLACSENTLMLSTDVVKQCLCLLKNNGVRRARLGGGEPTRHPGFMEIVRYSVNLGMDTIVYSNLYDVDKIIPELIKYPIRVVTSLHGDESFHDFITQTEGAYQRTYNNIVKLVSYNIPVTIHMVLMNENVHMVEQVVVEAIKIGVDKVTIQTLIPRERGREFIEENHATVFMLRQNLEKVRYLGEKYKGQITIHYNDMYEKEYYILEPDGSIYLESGSGDSDQLIRRLV